MRASLSPPGDLANEVCFRVEMACEVHECNPGWVNLMTATDGWLGEEARNAVRGCMDEGSCRNIQSCLAAWTHTLFSGTEVDLAPLDRDAYRYY